MTLSASIPALKNRAKQLHRAENIPLCQALDRVAAAEGYSTWSLLVAKSAPRTRALHDRLDAGDLVLCGARPGQGKTLCAIELLIDALRRHAQGWFFSLQNDLFDVNAMFERLGARRSAFSGSFVLEHSDQICAQHVIESVGASASERSIVVVDHLQLLDQRRRSPSLRSQVNDLGTFAKRTGSIVVLISQIQSAFDAKTKRLPSRSDIRLLDDLDLGVFDKLVFLHAGRVRVQRGRDA